MDSAKSIDEDFGIKTLLLVSNALQLAAKFQKQRNELRRLKIDKIGTTFEKESNTLDQELEHLDLAFADMRDHINHERLLVKVRQNETEDALNNIRQFLVSENKNSATDASDSAASAPRISSAGLSTINLLNLDDDELENKMKVEIEKELARINKPTQEE